MYQGKSWIGACFLYRREILEQIGGYSPEAFMAEDYEYWWRISLRFRMRPFHEVLYYYRRHSASLTDRYQAQSEAAMEKATQMGIARAPFRARTRMLAVATYLTLRNYWIRAELALRPRRRLRALAAYLSRMYNRARPAGSDGN